MEWSELIVDEENKLPAICLKCAARKEIVRRHEKLTAATASQGLGAVGGICGVMVARAMRDDPIAGAFVLGGTVVGSVVVGYVMHAHAPKAELALPLCRACNERWNRGIQMRWAILSMLAIGGVAIAYGFFAHDKDAYIVGAVMFAAMIVCALVFRLRDRFVWASSILAPKIVLKGVLYDAAAAIQKKRLTRPAKKELVP